MSGDVEENPGSLGQHTKDPLDSKCSEEHIYEISTFSIDWKMLGKRLIGSQATRDIDHEENSEQNKRDKMLEKWLEIKGCKATYRVLIEALQRTRNVQAAEAVQKLASSIVIDEVPQTVKAYKDYLESLYCQVQRPTDHWPPVMFDGYIKLATVLKFDNFLHEDACTKAMMNGNLKFVDQLKFIEIEQIGRCEDGTLANCIIVEGIPGVGKSTLAWQLGRRWAKGEILQQFYLVIVLHLRDANVQSAVDASKLLYHPDPDTQQSVGKWVSTTLGEKVLMILDGYDELPPDLQIKESSPFVKIIKGTELPKLTVLVTSRPSANRNLSELCRGQANCQYIEVVGFGEKEIQEYVEHSFKHQRLKNIKSFQDFFECHPHIHSLMYVPINCAIVVELFIERKETLPPTLTEIYIALTETLLKRYEKKTSDNPGMPQTAQTSSASAGIPTEVTCFRNLSPTTVAKLKPVAELAHEGTLKNQLIFREKPDTTETLGLLEMVPQLSSLSNPSYNFIHKTLQEFLTAWHVSTLPSFEQRDFLKNALTKPNLAMVVQFMAGLSKYQTLSENIDVFADIMKTDDVVHVAHLHWMFEIQKPSFIQRLMGNNKQTFICSHTRLNPFDLYVLRYCIVNSSTLWSVNLENCQMSEASMKMFLDGNVLDSITDLDLSENTISNPMASYLGRMLMTDNALEELYLRRCQLQPDGLQEVLKGVQGNTKLKILHLSRNSIDSKSASCLGTALKHNITLSELWLGMCDLGDEAICELCTGLKLCKIKTLVLENNPFGEKGANSLADVLKDNPTLEQLDMNECDKIPVPSPPIGLKAFSITSTSMTISWQPPHDPNGIIRGYQVSYTPHGVSEYLHDIVGDTTNTELTSLKPNTEYTIRVRAKTVDFGDYSTPVTVSTKEDDMLDEKLSTILANYEDISFYGFKIGKLIFYGTPRAGKTTLRKNLVKPTERILYSSDAPEPSTYIAEISDPILIEQVEEKDESVQRILAENKENNEWKWTVQGLDDVAKTLLQSLDIKLSNNEAKQQKLSNSTRDGMLHNPLNVTTGYENVEQPVQTAITTSTSGSAKALVHTEVEQPNRWVPTLPNANEKQHEQSSSSNVDIKQCFLDAIKTGRWSEVVSALNILDKAMLLQVIDGGGQSSFQEIFPLLIGCPAVKLIIFKLTDEFQTPYPAEYQPKHGRAQTWHDSGYVVRDFIFQAISSLPDLTTTDIPTKNPFDPKLLLVGTHKDELKGSEEMKAIEIQKYAESIRDLICETKEFESQVFKWIKGKNMEDFIVGVSNTNQKDIMEVKKKIEQLILQTDPIGIPAPWLVFDFVLHKYAKSQQLHKVEREMCNEIAKVCHLKDDEIEYVLYFLHNKAGTILYYHDIPELKNWIITDFQVVIDSISEVIIQYFGDSGKIGRMGQVRIESLRSIDGYLEVNQLLSLMKHRHIISYKEKATTFFMPSLLPKTEGEPVSSQSSDSLLVIFDSGYSPIGLFCAVSTHLIDSHNWEINTTDSQCRNNMSFYYMWSGAQYGIVFTAFSTYYEVHLPHNVEYPPKIKFDIYKAIQASFTTVCKDIDLVPPSYGFYCTCKGADCPKHAHTAKVGDGYEKMECCYSGVQNELTEQQRTWFHINQINHKDHRNDFKIPDAIKDVCCDVYTIRLSENGCLHEDDHHGFSIDFPSGILLPNQSITLTIGVMAYGPFIFPEGLRPISPIIWVFGDTNMDLKLLKDAKVILPHYLDIDERDDKEFEILFLKACPMNHDYTFNNKKQKYLFKSIGNATLLNDHKAVFSTNHFCSLCLAAKVSESIKEKIEYCMSVFIDITTRMYTFVVSYCLETCSETLKKHFNPVNKKTKFNFKCTDNMLTMHYSEVPLWILSLLKGNRIELTALDIWNADSDKLKWKEEEGLYFPSFELQFDPVNASTRSSKVSISFPEIKSQIELPLLVNTPPVPATSGGSGSPNALLGGNPDNQDGRRVEVGGTADFTSVSGDTLMEDDLVDVMQEMMDMAARWRPLGLALRLRAAELETIFSKNHTDPTECLRDMLHSWLQQHYDTTKFGQPSWRLLCQAIHKPVGGNNPRLAKEIAGRHYM